MQKILLGIFVLLILVVALEGGYYTFLVSRKPAPSPTTSSLPVLSTAKPAMVVPTIIAKLVTLYRNKNDSLGRTIIYSSDNKDTLNGAGLHQEILQMPYIVGLYAKRENIAGTNDYYVFLTNPLVSNKALDPIRITAATKFGMEFLDKPGIILINSAEHHLLDGNPLTNPSLFDKTIQPGDAIIILPQVDNTTNKYGRTTYGLKKDNQGNLIGEALATRRNKQ